MTGSRRRPAGLARFIATLTAGVIAVIIGLCVVFIMTTTRMERMANRINETAAEIALMHRFSVELLLYRRDMLLDQIGEDTAARARMELHFEKADDALDRLMISGPAGAGGGTFLDVAERFREFGRVARDPRRSPIAMRGLVDHVIESVEAHEAELQSRMDAYAEEARRLNRESDLIAWTCLLVAPALVALSGFVLWRRIARPVFSLIDVAERFGRHELDARAPVDRDDEMGELARTFNGMAEDIQQHERDRREFAGAVVHDLNAPLTVIGGAAHLLMKGLPPEKSRAWLERIIAQTRRLTAMTEDLLESSRILAGQLDLHLSPVDLSNLVAVTVREQGLVHPRREIRWTVPEPCVVLIDERRIQRVLDNLISNAVKYSDTTSPVEVTLDVDAHRATISIADRGSGISEEELRQLFKPFSRLARTERKVRGTGLGLFSVKQIIDAHHGSIRIESEKGRGTTVRVDFLRDAGDDQEGGTPGDS